ncbi:MAG TPA: ankyrin repeat domain-containing protein [Steroidobacteraceae bacterium]|nr:ankyrin repeat domain-containing protein [Steroidobacteraceae bacterium]
MSAQAASKTGADAREAADALLQAAYEGDAARVARLIKAGAPVNEANVFGATPMGEAARRGDTAVLKVLLEAGADPESPNAEGQTALMSVARTGNVEAAKLLLKHGAKIDAREKWGGQTALMWASAQNQPDMIRFLASKGADVNARSVVRDWPRRMTAEERPKDMNRGGLSGLMFAARDGKIEAVRALLAAGANVNFADPDGSTTLIVALMNGHWDVAKLLVDSGAEVNTWDWWGQTPLYMAVDMNTLPTGARVELPTMDFATGVDIIKLLIAKGANVNAQLKLRPPYRNVGQDRLADPAIDYGATPLLRAAKAADIPAMKALLAAGALVDLPNAYGHTPLIVAAGATRGRATPTRGGNYSEEQAIEAVKLLLDHGANVNAAAYTLPGAPRGEALRCTGYVIIPDCYKGETAMHGAALHGWVKLAAVLKQAGAALDPQDADGKTPLDYAMGRYRLGFLENQPAPQLKVAEALRALGATKESPNAPAMPPGARPIVVAEVPVLPY